MQHISSFFGDHMVYHEWWLSPNEAGLYVYIWSCLLRVVFCLFWLRNLVFFCEFPASLPSSLPFSFKLTCLGLKEILNTSRRVAMIEIRPCSCFWPCDRVSSLGWSHCQKSMAVNPGTAAMRFHPEWWTSRWTCTGAFLMVLFRTWSCCTVYVTNRWFARSKPSQILEKSPPSASTHDITYQNDSFSSPLHTDELAEQACCKNRYPAAKDKSFAHAAAAPSNLAAAITLPLFPGILGTHRNIHFEKMWNPEMLK